MNAFFDSVAFLPPPCSYSRSLPSLRFLGEIAYADLEPRAAAAELPLIFFCHGNAEDLGQCVPALQLIADAANARVVTLDYPGYGLSAGRAGHVAALAAARDVLVHVRAEFAPRSFVLMGRSLGSGPICRLARECADAGTPPAALILLSAFVSAVRVAVPRWLWPVVALGPFRNVDELTYSHLKRARCGVDAPVLFIHGRLDDVVPFVHGVTLCERVRSVESRHTVASLWVAEADHNNIEHALHSAGTPLEGVVAAFVKQHCAM